MKKLIALLSCAMMLAGCASSSGGNSGNTDNMCSTLKVFSPGEYIGEDVIYKFEKKFGVNVVYDLFASNEEMYTKLLSGETYDVLVPSDYMIERLIQEDRLQGLDWSKIPNKSNVITDLLGQDFDPETKYAAPYFWGTVGIIYNTKAVNKADVERLGWDIFRDTKYKGRIYFYDSERDAFMIALKALGYSMNSKDEGEIEKAYQWLSEMNKTMSPVYLTDEVIDNMISEVKDIAYVYSGDATYMIAENEDLAFYAPHQGTNLWTDAMVITKDSQCVDLAHEWINFILSDEISEENTLYVGYASPNQKIFDKVSQDSEEGFGDIDAYVPRLGYELDEEFRYDEVQRKKISELWTMVKAGN